MGGKLEAKKKSATKEAHIFTHNWDYIMLKINK
jgi:hypothetical protein